MKTLNVSKHDVVIEDNGDKSQVVDVTMKLKNGKTAAVYGLSAERRGTAQSGYVYFVRFEPHFVYLGDVIPWKIALDAARRILRDWAEEDGYPFGDVHEPRDVSINSGRETDTERTKGAE